MTTQLGATARVSPAVDEAQVLRADARDRQKRRYRRFADGVAVIGLTLLAWQGLVDLGFVHPFFISKPTLIARELFSLFASGYILPHLLITCYEALLGLILGTLLGMIAGFVSGLSERVASALEPIVVAFSSMPRVAIAPLFIIWFGFGPESKIALATMVVFFGVFFNTFAGVRSIEPVLINNIRTMGGSEFQVLHYVTVPVTFAWVFAATKTSISLALISAVVGEFVGSQSGIGFVMLQASGTLDTTRLFACMIILALFGSLLFAVVKKLEDRALRWRPS